jgi:maleylacetoacetate isomerase
MSGYVLYDFPRSSASYRLRIALALKGIDYKTQPIDLRSGEQRGGAYLEVNPSGLVPTLVLPDGRRLGQSIALLRYLDSITAPRLFPLDPVDDANVSAMVLTIACDIHPLNNLRVLGYIQSELGASDQAKDIWYRHWVGAGFATLEALVKGQGGSHCYGDRLTAADVCLVPQMANARRFNVDLSAYPELVKRDAMLTSLAPFVAAAPPPL